MSTDEASAADTITVIRARGRRLAKLVTRDKVVQDYDAAKTFDLFAVSVTNLAGVCRLLESLSRRQDCAVVRGAIADPKRVRRVRRLVHPDRATGDAATLCDIPRRWLALDVEGLPPPAGISAIDLQGCANAARLHLPSTFGDAACIVQATAGHGLKPDIRLRFWFWLSRPASRIELRRWFGGSPADPSVFNAAQIIYTAAPAFEPGLQDHLLRRMILLPGNSDIVSVPAPAPPPTRFAPPRCWQMAGRTLSQRYIFAALLRGAARVSTAPVNARHATALREAHSLTRFVAAGLLSEIDVRRALGSALVQAGKSMGEADAIVDWAMAHMSSTSLPVVAGT